MSVQDRWTDTSDPKKSFKDEFESAVGFKIHTFFEGKVSNHSLSISLVTRGLFESLNTV